MSASKIARKGAATGHLDSDLFSHAQHAAQSFMTHQGSYLLALQVNMLMEAVLVVAQELRDLTRQLGTRRGR